MSQLNSSLENLKPLLEERGELATALKRIQARIKELDADIRPVLEGRGEVVANGYSFNCKLIAGRKTLDKKAMIEDGIDLTFYEKKGAPYTTLTVKAVEEI